MNKERILVVEDEEDILHTILFHLRREGYDADGVVSGEEGLEKLRTETYHLLLLDLMLPGMDGIEVCRIARTDVRTRRLPIVILTARGEESDQVAGLEVGADQYLVKPFSPKVLLARIRAILRRESEAVEPEEITRVGGIEINPTRHEVRVGGEKVRLTAMEFALLNLLARRPGWVFSREQIIDGIKGEDYVVTSRSVDVHILSLRRKLREVSSCIETVRGIGYRLQSNGEPN